MYVQNLRRKRGQSLKEIADNVKKYCFKQDVRVMNAFVIRNKFVEDTVGCQLTVPLRQYDKVITDSFWPCEVTCKKWEHRTSPGSSNSTDYSDNNLGHRPRSKVRGRDHSRSAVRGRGRDTGRDRSRSAGSHGGRHNQQYDDHWDYDNERNEPNRRGSRSRSGQNRNKQR